MGAISIVALVLGVVAVVLLIAVLALTVRGGKKKNDSSVEIGQATVDVIKGEIARDGQTTRENVLSAMGLQNTSIQNALNANQTAILDTVRKEEERTERLQTNVYEGFATLTTELKNSLKELNESNEKQLDKMRATVDEKLNENLDNSFQKSFKMVSDRIDAITKGFGEMQTLTSGMSDLKRVLSNVKTRGTWGEMALDNLLSQLLTPEQYDKNVALTKSENADRVDFVINLPGKTSDKVMLPIDAKFPLETYQHVLDAQNEVQIKEAKQALAVRLRAEAISIKSKYIRVPKTTDFAILYLPIEGLFAEAMQIRGLSDELLNNQRIILAGPTTLAALLNSLQMGFRTVQIEKRSSEIYKLWARSKRTLKPFVRSLKKRRKSWAKSRRKSSAPASAPNISRNDLTRLPPTTKASRRNFPRGNYESKFAYAQR